MDHRRMPVPRTRLLTYDLSLVLVIDHLRQVVIPLIARLLPHGVQAEDNSFGGRGMAPLGLGLVVAAFDVAEEFLFSVQKLSIFLFLDY